MRTGLFSHRNFALILSLLCFSAGLLTPEIFSQLPAKASPPHKMTDADVVQDLTSYLDGLVAEDRFSGAVLVAKDGKPFFERAYGYANHAFNAPNRVDTKFNLGSMGKMFTAVAVLQLAQQGKLSLDDTLGRLVPDYPDKVVANKVTIHQLLTHTSGMGSYFNDKFKDSSRSRFRAIRDYLPLIAGEPLQFEPGTKWSYSNSGMMVLGLVIESVSGQTYFDYVREHIFKPTGMVNTDNYDVDADVPNLALGYTRLDSQNWQPTGEKGPRRTNIFMHVARGGAAGGGYSTVEDLLKFAQALQKYELLNGRYTDQLLTGKVDMPEPGAKYGYGMIERQVSGVHIVGHGGNFPGINSDLDMYINLGYTVAVMSNYDNGAQPVVERLRRELTGQGLP